MALQVYRDSDQNENSHSCKVPVQEISYDRSKEEYCCNVMIDSYSFLRRIPAASSFLLVLTTLVSYAASYLGKELVFPRKKKEIPHLSGSTLTVEEGQLSVHSSSTKSRKEQESPSSRRSNESNHNDEFQEPTNHLAPPERQFSSPNPMSPSPPRKHSQQQQAPLGRASSNSSHVSQPRTSQEQRVQPREYESDKSNRPCPVIHSSSLGHTSVSDNQQAVIINERLQSSSTAVSTTATEPFLGEDSGETIETVRGAAECLHAQDFGQMRRLLSDIRAESVGSSVALAVQFGLGQANFKLKQYSQAETHFSELDNRARTLGEKWKGDRSIANYYLGEICYVRSIFGQAAVHYRMALDSHSTEVSVAKIYKIIPPSRSGLWSKLAAALRNGSKVVDAIAAYREAIACASAKKDKLAAHTSLGNLLQNSGENAQAVEEYKHSIRLSEELGDNVSLGWAHGNIGNAYLGLGYRDKAIHHLKTALELTLQHEPTPAAIGRAYNNLGTAHQALNELQTAQEYYDLALAQAIYGSDTAGQARVYGNIGNLKMLLKQYDGSIAHYTETLNTTKDKATKVTAHHNRGCANYEKAEIEKRKYYVTIVSSPVNTGASVAAQEREAGKQFALTYHGKEVEKAVETQHKLPALPRHVQKWYKRSLEDLAHVVSQHELSFGNIKGSRKGLTLSVSLFETNARTFHRLLDCHYNLGEWERALEYAEQSRARTLGELLLERKRGQLEVDLVTPLDIGQIERVVGSQPLDVVVVSYTGSRVLVWVLSPGTERVGDEGQREVRKAMFQVAVEENGFDGKSLDYYLHYLLSEELVEKNVEMYAYSDYQASDYVSPIVRLHELFAEPLLMIMSCLHPPQRPGQVQDVVFIPDSYINVLPLVALFNRASQQFLGDRYRFRIMPSLLSMGILDQMPPVEVHVPRDGNKFCVVGNPAIPTFSVKGKTWSLGKLPFATEEAQWVSYILDCKSTLHEQATKSVVMMMVAGARMIHIATHGSAASGFLAFASLEGTGTSEPIDEKSVLIYPDDIEKMAINPALVVLSSCDSSRGTVKADGVQGMARAFILAGAQSVMTTLWRVPDESAAVFMKFFYQYLVDGHPSTTALQKAILSVRSFTKYSGFVHWSGYQLTGREVRVVAAEGDEGERRVREAVGGEGPTVFPRLDVIQTLEKNILEKAGGSNSPPTDVQVVHGPHGLSPAGSVRDFVLRHHSAFPGGVFWLNGRSEFLNGALELVNAVCLEQGFTEQCLVILDDVKSLPQSASLRELLKSRSTGIIIISHSSHPPESLKQEIDQQLIRGWTPISIQPLSTVHTTQRIVHSVMSLTHFTPLNREQKLLEKIASLTSGCPGLVTITNSLLNCCLEEAGRNTGSTQADFLHVFASKVNVNLDRSTRADAPSSSELPAARARARAGSFRTNRYLSELISAFQLPPPHLFVLRTLSVFSPQPVPLSLVDIVQCLVAKAAVSSAGHSRVAPSSITNLLSTKLLRSYPSPVICPPTNPPPPSPTTSQLPGKYLFVPQLVQDTLWEHMDDRDIVFTITTAYRALLEMTSRPSITASGVCFATGLTECLVARCDSNSCISEGVYREIFKMFVDLQLRSGATSQSNAPV